MPGEKTKELEVYLKAVVAVTRAVESDLEVWPVLTATLRQVLSVTGFSGAAVQILDQAAGRLRHVSALGQGKAALAALDGQMPGVGLCGRVIAAAGPFFLTDLDQGGPETAELVQAGFRSLAVVPIPSAAGVMGLIVAAGPEGVLGRDCLVFLDALAGQLGVALENLGLIKEVVAASQEWQATFHAISDLIAVFDADKRLTRLNKALAERLNLDPDRPAPLSCREILGGELCGCNEGKCFLEEALGRQRPRTREVVGPRLGGRFLITVSPLPDEGVVLIARDVSLVGELQAARDQAARLQEMDRFKSALVAEVSHEFRTPLHGAISTAQMLADGLYGELAAEQKEAVADVLASSQRLLLLVNDLIDLTRIDAGQVSLEIEPFSLEEAIRSALSQTEARAREKRVEVRVVDLPGGKLVLGDPVRIKRVLVSLVNRAIDRTPAGGRAVVAARPKGGFIQIRVADPGPATDQTAQALGLTLARRLVGLHQERLEVSSSQDPPGSMVSFKLPEVS